MNSVKVFLKKIIKLMIKILLEYEITSRVVNELGRSLIHNIRVVEYNDIKLTFHVVNYLTKWRVNTFHSKEPETLAWIDRFRPGSTFWDVGANIGLYTCYAAVARNCQVVAFEPSVFNTQLLAQNISVNQVVDQVVVCPFPLSDIKTISKLKFPNVHWGGALSTFKENFGWNGEPFESEFEYLIPSTTLDEFAEMYGAPHPDYLKIDVDGIEHLILQGGEHLLKGISEILVEVNDDFEQQRVCCSDLLTRLGFTMEEKKHSEIIEKSTDFHSTFNQIWKRNEV